MSTDNLLIPKHRIEELAGKLSRETDLGTAPVVAVSAVMCKNPTSLEDRARFAAALHTAATSHEASIPHLFMVDSVSDPLASEAIREHGGIVIPVQNGTEGGLARPYITAARIIDMVAPSALMVKVEGEKPIFANRKTECELLEAANSFDIITGVRDADTWGSMPAYLRLTESMMALAIRDIAGVPYDTPSGVLAMNKAGRRVFIARTTEPAWQYLLSTPALGKSLGLRVGQAPVTFEYHPEIVAEENGNLAMNRKRRDQFSLMLDYAVTLAGGEEMLNDSQQQALASAAMMLSALHELAAV